MRVSARRSFAAATSSIAFVILLVLRTEPKPPLDVLDGGH